MKKETCQHGMIKSHKVFSAPTSKPNSKPITNHFDQPPPAAKSVTKVSSKSNAIRHSKSIEKHGKPRSVEKCGKPRCAGCYFCKSNDTGKVSNKIRSCDVGLKHKLVSGKGGVENKGLHGLKFGGISASQALDQLSNYTDFDETDDENEDGDGDRYDGRIYYRGYDDGGIYGGEDGLVIEEESVQEEFCDVGYFVIEHVDGDEEWCLVGEL